MSKLLDFGTMQNHVVVLHVDRIALDSDELKEKWWRLFININISDMIFSLQIVSTFYLVSDKISALTSNIGHYGW